AGEHLDERALRARRVAGEDLPPRLLEPLQLRRGELTGGRGGKDVLLRLRERGLRRRGARGHQNSPAEGGAREPPPHKRCSRYRSSSLSGSSASSGASSPRISWLIPRPAAATPPLPPPSFDG